MESEETRKKSLLAKVTAYFLTAAGILGGVFLLIQYGQMLGNSSLEEHKTLYEQSLAQLQHQMELLSERHQVEIQRLQANLESEQEANAKLRVEFARLQKDFETTQSQLDKERGKTRQLQGSLQELEKDRNDLQRMVDERRPLLRISFNDVEAPGKIVAIVKNSSEIPIRIIQKRGLSWLNGLPGTEIPIEQTIAIPPGYTADIFTFEVRGDLMPLRRGETVYRAALCLIYETALSTDRRRWLTEHWFEYNRARPNGHYIIFWKQDDRSLKGVSDGCNLERLMPSGWLDMEK